MKKHSNKELQKANFLLSFHLPHEELVAFHRDGGEGMATIPTERKQDRQTSTFSLISSEAPRDLVIVRKASAFES